MSSREADLNEELAPHKHVLLPDVLQEEVARNVGFTSSRQTLRPTIEPLQPVRIYVVHDNIEVIEEDATYSPMNDNSIYSMVLKPTEHRGWYKDVNILFYDVILRIIYNTTYLYFYL